MKKIINQAPIVRHRTFVSEIIFLFFGLGLFQQNRLPGVTLMPDYPKPEKMSIPALRLTPS